MLLRNKKRVLCDLNESSLQRNTRSPPFPQKKQKISSTVSKLKLQEEEDDDDVNLVPIPYSSPRRDLKTRLDLNTKITNGKKNGKNKENDGLSIPLSESIFLLTPPSTPRKIKKEFLDIKTSTKKLNFTSSSSPSFSKIADDLLSNSPTSKSFSMSLTRLEKSPTTLHIKEESIYSTAKSLFSKDNNNNLNNNNNLIYGRLNEQKTLKSFLIKNLKNESSNSLYISGPPATGKTIFVSKVINELLKSDDNVKDDEFNNVKKFNLDGHTKTVSIANINCMTISNPNKLFEELYYSLITNDENENNQKLLSSSSVKKSIKKSVRKSPRKRLPVSNKSKKVKSFEEEFEKLITKSNSSKSSSIILILDEIDSLLSSTTKKSLANSQLQQEILYKIFQLSNSHYKTNSKLILIGISNTLDLTNRLLPKLKIFNIFPNLLSFLPYTVNDIINIITIKLKSIKKLRPIGNDNDTENDKDVPLIHLAAIQLCARKSVSNSSDLRKTFDVCYHALELIEQETLQKMINSSMPKNNDDNKENEAPDSEMEALLQKKNDIVLNKNKNAPNLYKLNYKTAPKVTILQIMKCFNLSLLNKQKTISKLSNLNLQSKIILCCLSLSLSSPQVIIMTINKLYDYYINLSNRNRLTEFSYSYLQLNEFLEIINNLESLSLINISYTKSNNVIGPTRLNFSNNNNMNKFSVKNGMNDIGNMKINKNFTKIELEEGVKNISLLKGLLELNDE